MLRYIKLLRHPRTAFGKLKTKFRMNFYNIGYRMIGSLDGIPFRQRIWSIWYWH